MEKFASTMLVTIHLPEEKSFEENRPVITKLGPDCVVENKTSRDKKLMKSTVALYVIQNNFQYKVTSSTYESMC